MSGGVRCAARQLIARLGVAGVLFAGACTTSSEPPRPVTEREAMASFDDLFALASRRTNGAMVELCELPVEPCPLFGMSGGVVDDARGPVSAPRPQQRPTVLCSYSVGGADWMLVVEGADGLERPYVSQVLFARNEDGRVVPFREPAFWLGVGYSSEPSARSGSWSLARSPSEHTDSGHTEEVLRNARRGCES